MIKVVNTSLNPRNQNHDNKFLVRGLSKFKNQVLLILVILGFNFNAQAQSQDLDINQIISPAVCLNSPGNYAVTVELINNGVTNLNGQTAVLQYSLNGGFSFQGTQTFIPSTLGTTGATETFTFAALAGLPTANTYSIIVRISTQVGGDGDTNDQLSANTTVQTNFVMSATSGCIDNTVSFNDASAPTPSSWLWDFGDGNSSTLPNPTHVYSDTGTYTITLQTNNGFCFGSMSRTYTVLQPVANISLNPTTGCALPHTVFFTDQSILPDTWLWDFGDGFSVPSTSTLQNPVHNYTSPGIFTVSLTVTDTINGCTSSDEAVVEVSVVNAGISFLGGGSVGFPVGCGPLTVDFLDASNITGPGTITGWNWNFGDGNTSTAQNPSHTYNDPGAYTVTLTTTASNGCSGTVTLTNFVQVRGPIVGFTQDVTTGCAPLTVNFTDTSSHTTAGVEWLWNFGDGNTSTSQNPTNIYNSYGSFDVSVTVTDDDGCVASHTQTNLINPADAIPPTITCPSSEIAYLDVNCQATLGSYDAVTFSDNCTIDSIVQSPPIGTIVTTNTLVTLTVYDNALNSTSCNFMVNLMDTLKPIITCPGNIALNNDAGQCGAIASYTTPVGTDNCSGVTTVQSAGLASGSFFPIGTTTNTFVSTDASGNIDSCSFDVIISDTEAPSITCPADIIQSNDPGSCFGTVTFSPPSFSDNCPGATISQTGGSPSGTGFGIGVNVITYTATDAAGNISTCSFSITVNDTELPTISCPSDIAQNNDAGQCSAIVTYAAPTTADNCIITIVNQTAGLPSGSAFPVGTTTNTFVVFDAHGNSATCSFDVVISDTELPTISCLPDIFQSNDAGQCGALINYNPPLGLDNCPGSTTIQTAGLPGGSIFPIGTTTNTFQVTDAAGNVATCSFNVVISDTELPTISCPANIAQNNDVGQCSAVVTFTAPVGLDNCPGSTTAQTAGLSSGSAFPVGTTTNTFEVTDVAGNVTSCSFDVVISDTESPTITCATNITQNNDIGVCGAVVIYTTPVGLDNCLGSTTIQTAGLPSGSLFFEGTTTNTFEVTDAAGNVTTCSFDVVILDAEFPTITCPADITQNNDPGQCDAVVTFTDPAGADNCPDVSTIQVAGLPSGSQFPVGTTTNTFEVIDLSGNVTTCSFDVIIVDSELPTITCPSDIAQINDMGQCGAIITFVDPVGVDNCPGSVTVQIAGLTSGSLFPVGTTTNTFEVTDASGNTVTCSFDVVITDTELPTISCPSDISQINDIGQCGAVITFVDPIGLDNCPGSVTVQIAGLASGSLFPVGTTTNTFEVTDPSGNVASCSFDVVITDAELPTITCPADIAQNNDIGFCGAIVTFTDPIGLDNCPGSVTVQIAGLTSGTLFPVGTTTNTFEVTDAAGNVTTCSFDVVITDTELPTITCPADIAQNNDLGICGAVVTFTDPIGLDNCPGSVTIQIAGLASGSLFPIGTTTNTFEVTDAAGNVTTCSFDVVITDSELPTITCLANIAQNNDLGLCSAVVTFINPVGVDNCPGSVTVQTAGLPSGSAYPIGTTTNTFEVTDAAGNVANCSFDVVITDAELPTITCPANIAQNNDIGDCGAIITFTAPVGADNCPASVTTQIAGLPSGSLFPVGTTTNTFEVVDASGNTATCSFDVVITDAELPTITCPGDIAQDNNIGDCGAIITFTTPVGLDNCPASITIQTAGLATGSLFPVGTTTNTFEVTDASGNVATCSFDVVITDAELPTITCPADIIQDNDLGDCGAIVTYAPIVGLDNCAGQLTTQIEGLPSAVFYPKDTTTNTYEVVDLAGNVATCSFDVIILDAELPTITCSDGFESCDSVLTVEDPVITDNCPNAIFELTDGLPSDTIFPVGITVNEYTVTDSSGNQATCTVEITRFALPVIDAGPDLEVDAGKSVDIDATSSNVNIYDWVPSDGLDNSIIEDPVANPFYTTEYTILVISDDGCEASDVMTVTVNLVIEANNFMSPNDDGKNDTWIVKGNYLLDDCNIKIYSSWGNLVFESDGYDNSWDGTIADKALPEGIYYYVISCGSDDPVSGSITLIR